MQIFVKSLCGKTLCFDVESSDPVGQLKARIQEREGIPAHQQRLLVNGKQLEDGRTLSAYDVKGEAVVQLTLRLKGGVRMKVRHGQRGARESGDQVRMMTAHLPCGAEVEIEVDQGDTLREVKTKLEVVTGVPVRSQKVLLTGIGEIAMGDKRTNLKFAKCGTANSMALATMGHEDR